MSIIADTLSDLVFNDSRISVIEGDFWIKYTRAQEALDQIEFFINKPDRKRPQNLALIADTNNGKTTIIDRILRTHPKKSCFETNEFEWPVFIIEQPSQPDEKRLYDTMLAQLGLPVRPTESPQSKLETIVTVLSNLKTKMIVIDEFHKMLVGSPAKQRMHLNGIRSLGNRLKRPVLIAGTKEARSALMADPELANRFDTLEIKRWDYSKDFLKFLASLERVIALENPSGLASPEVSKKIHALSEGTIGEIVNIVRKCALSAIQSGTEQITLDTIDSCGWVIPSVRQRQ